MHKARLLGDHVGHRGRQPRPGELALADAVGTLVVEPDPERPHVVAGTAAVRGRRVETGRTWGSSSETRRHVPPRRWGRAWAGAGRREFGARPGGGTRALQQGPAGPSRAPPVATGPPTSEPRPSPPRCRPEQGGHGDRRSVPCRDVRQLRAGAAFPRPHRYTAGTPLTGAGCLGTSRRRVVPVVARQRRGQPRAPGRRRHGSQVEAAQQRGAEQGLRAAGAPALPPVGRPPSAARRSGSVELQRSDCGRP